MLDVFIYVWVRAWLHISECVCVCVFRELPAVLHPLDLYHWSPLYNRFCLFTDNEGPREARLQMLPSGARCIRWSTMDICAFYGAVFWICEQMKAKDEMTGSLYPSHTGVLVVIFSINPSLLPSSAMQRNCRSVKLVGAESEEEKSSAGTGRRRCHSSCSWSLKC